MGLSLVRSLKNKEKTYTPPWKHIVQGYVAHKISPVVWTFEELLKKKQSVSFLSTTILSTFLQNCSIIYVANFFPHHSCAKCSLQWTQLLEVQTHIRQECSKEASILLWPHLLTSQNKKPLYLEVVLRCFFHMSPESLDSTFHLYYVR